MEVPGLLLVGPVVGDDLGIAGVGSLGAEDDGGPAGDAEDLVEQGQLDLPVPLAAQLGTEMSSPQIVVAHFLFHRVDDGSQLVVERVELPVRIEQVEGFDLVGHELAGPVQLCLKLRFSGEIPGHYCPFLVVVLMVQRLAVACCRADAVRCRADAVPDRTAGGR